jgi:hypothetical protein
MFHWKATTLAGEELSQKDPITGTSISSQVLDGIYLATFELLKVNSPVLSIQLHPGQTVKYCRRVEKRIGKSDVACHIIAVSTGQILDQIYFYFEQGNLFVKTAWEEGHPWFYSMAI